MKKKEGRNPWVFTPKRKEAMRKAQREHAYLVSLGRRAKARGMR